MNLSKELKRALIKKETFFTKEDEKYFADPHWTHATKLTFEAKYPECQMLVAEIDKDHRRYY